MKRSLLTALCALAGWAGAIGFAHAGPVLDKVRAGAAVRICIWPDYYGITFRNPKNQALSGLDIDLSAEFARSLGVKLVYVDSSFATLTDDLLKDKCDVSMHAVGVTAQRQQALRFSHPYLRSDIYGVTTKSNRTIRGWDDIDQPGVVVAVQAGTYMEPVMKASLKQARMLIVKPPQTREQELESGRADVFMTDFPYSRRLLDNADWARIVAPPRTFSPISYAYAVRPGDEEWLKTVDAFVSAIKRDGRLDAAARRYGLAEIIER